MTGINARRVILGGLVAGLVANGFDFVITTYLMATEFASMMARLNVGEAAMRLHTPQSYLKSSALYLVSALVSSLVGASLYKE